MVFGIVWRRSPSSGPVSLSIISTFLSVVFDGSYALERKKAFSIFHIICVLDVIGIPTLGAFSSAAVAWSIMFCWTVGLCDSTPIIFS